MCILFIAVDQHPRYPLIIAANRDERHARPSEAMHRWPDQPGILAGRDRYAGGTWFGVNARGRVAAVTNHHGAASAVGKRSRGELATRFLVDQYDDQHDDQDYDEFLRQHQHEFNPFNLLYGEPGRLHLFSNVGPLERQIASGFHSISNGSIDDRWPKMSHGVLLLKEKILSGCDIDAADLIQVMRDQTKPHDDRPASSRGVAVPEKYHSPIFITGEDYGTRTTTLLLGTEDELLLYEYNYFPNGDERDRRQYSLVIQR